MGIFPRHVLFIYNVETNTNLHNITHNASLCGLVNVTMGCWELILTHHGSSSWDDLYHIKLPTSHDHLSKGPHNGITPSRNVMLAMFLSYVGLIYQMNYVGTRFGMCSIFSYSTLDLGMKLELSTTMCVLPSVSLAVTNGLPWFQPIAIPSPYSLSNSFPLSNILSGNVKAP